MSLEIQFVLRGGRNKSDKSHFIAPTHMHNSARMLFRDFIFLCLGNGSFELEIGSGTLLCAHYAHNICAAGPLWKFLCAHLSVWEQRPDLLIADNQCSVIVTNCTKIVSSENLIKIRIRYKYDKKGSFSHLTRLLRFLTMFT